MEDLMIQPARRQVDFSNLITVEEITKEENFSYNNNI